MSGQLIVIFNNLEEQAEENKKLREKIAAYEEKEASQNINSKTYDNVLNNNKQNNFVDNKEKSGIYSLNKGQLKVLRQDILYFDEKKYVDEEEIAKVKKL